jgi:ketosteroid isomerase-like protein
MERRQFLLGTLALGALMSGGGAARAARQEDAATVQAEIQAIADRYTKAIENKQFDSMTETFAEDWKGTSVVGDAATRTQLQDYWRQALGEAKDIKFSQKVTDLKVEKDTASALLRTKASATLPGPDGNTLNGTLDGASIVTYAKTADGWKAKSTEDLWESVKLDGVPFPLNESEEEAEAHQAAQNHYDALTRALKANDADALDKMFPAGFVAVTPERELSRDQFVDDLKRGIVNSKIEEFTYQIERVRLSGDTLTTHGTVRLKIEDDGRKIAGMFATRDTLKKVATGGKGWEFSRFNVLYQDMAMDGTAQKPKTRLNPSP